VGSSDEKTPGQLPDRAPKCLTQQLCMLMFRTYRCYTAASLAITTGSIRSIRRVQASPAGTPHRHAQTFQERFSGVSSHDCRFWEAQAAALVQLWLPMSGDMACQSTRPICWFTIRCHSAYALHSQLNRYYSVHGLSL
jgi:hypothetical protein